MKATGLLLLTGFAGIAAAGSFEFLYKSTIEKAAADSKQRIFVQLVSGSRQSTYSSTHYFYTYSFVYNNRTYKRTEEVSSSFYHLHSEGTNTEAMLYPYFSFRPYVRLIDEDADQKQPAVPDWLFLSVALSVAGFFTFITGVLLPEKKKS